MSNQLKVRIYFIKAFVTHSVRSRRGSYTCQRKAWERDACRIRARRVWEQNLRCPGHGESTQKDPDGLEKYAGGDFLAGEKVEP